MGRKRKATREALIKEIENGKDLLWIQSKFGYSSLAICVAALKYYEIDTKPLFQQLDNRNKSVNRGIEDCLKKPLLSVSVNSGVIFSRMQEYLENTIVRSYEVAE